MKKISVFSVVSAVLFSLCFVACKDSISMEVMPDTPPPPVCELTKIGTISESSPGSGFVGLTRLADGTVLVASANNVYKANLKTGAFTKVAGNPDLQHLIVGISSAPGQPTLVARGNGVYRLDGNAYTLLATSPNIYGFTSIAQEENKAPLVTVGRDLYQLDLASNQLTHLANSPDGYFFERVSRRAGFDPLVATGYTIYRYSNGSLTPVLHPAEYHYEQVESMSPLDEKGLIFVTGYEVNYADAAGTMQKKLMDKPDDEWIYFSDISVGDPEDILVTSGHYLYRLKADCVTATR